jgi:hypothetical protein
MEAFVFALRRSMLSCVLCVDGKKFGSVGRKCSRQNWREHLAILSDQEYFHIKKIEEPFQVLTVPGTAVRRLVPGASTYQYRYRTGSLSVQGAWLAWFFRFLADAARDDR